MISFAEQIIRFYREINLDIVLPPNVAVMHPHIRPKVAEVSDAFYNKFYNDTNPRTFIIGINPGRFGGGVTGVPFTDPLKLEKYCGLPNNFERKTELSSDFIYRVIEAYGGAYEFYGQYYFTALSPLGFTRLGLNMNYYDDKLLAKTLMPMMAGWMETQLNFGGNRGRCICLGSGKNLSWLQKLNNQWHFFDKIEVLDHPRFIMQYRRKKLDEYVEQYVKVMDNG